MDVSEHLAAPDEHLDPVIAATYDRSLADRFSPETVAATVEFLAALAGDGPVVEFAVGTGRIALPLAATGVPVFGIDFSEPMLAELQRKPGADRVALTVGDMTTARVCSDASLVYLVFNTIGNLRTQRQQVACFRNAAAHLRPGGRFVIENGTPQIHRLPAGESILAVDVSPQHLGFDEYADRVNQILISHHSFVEGGKVRVLSGAFRYVWPSELDLMAELAGMTLEARWSTWRRDPYSADSPSHVSVWRKGKHGG
ncbi:MAG TPA: class I SAM-dependent methyltransferase [Acidimicrobiia bacterium]|nr:class I SAM-dependent methyltransferase [Acidimicrobiia bacterium]